MIEYLLIVILMTVVNVALNLGGNAFEIMIAALMIIVLKDLEAIKVKLGI